MTRKDECVCVARRLGCIARNIEHRHSAHIKHHPIPPHCIHTSSDHLPNLVVVVMFATDSVGMVQGAAKLQLGSKRARGDVEDARSRDEHEPRRESLRLLRCSRGSHTGTAGDGSMATPSRDPEEQAEGSMGSPFPAASPASVYVAESPECDGTAAKFSGIEVAILQDAMNGSTLQLDDHMLLERVPARTYPAFSVELQNHLLRTAAAGPLLSLSREADELMSLDDVSSRAVVHDVHAAIVEAPATSHAYPFEALHLADALQLSERITTESGDAQVNRVVVPVLGLLFAFPDLAREEEEEDYTRDYVAEMWRRTRRVLQVASVWGETAPEAVRRDGRTRKLLEGIWPARAHTVPLELGELPPAMAAMATWHWVGLHCSVDTIQESVSRRQFTFVGAVGKTLVAVDGRDAVKLLDLRRLARGSCETTASGGGGGGGGDAVEASSSSGVGTGAGVGTGTGT